ncbi:MAG: gliding motility-associated C-terminal domain-containing protein [Bacteroidetes bacterium]|nr:gliding motility-associated C-terminal domain-containing protein [Bacteroidota bacterium]
MFTKHQSPVKKMLLAIALLVSVYGNSQFTWNTQNSGLTAEFIADIFFKDLSKGWAVGQGGVILNTTDGGATWVQQTSPVSVDLHSVCFSSATTGWIVGDNETLLKSVDGGITWDVAPQPSGTSSHLYEIHFVDADHGWILGFLDNFRTIDGGLTWIPFSPFGGTMYDVHFINPNEGWICGVSAYLGFSTDGGITWTQVAPLSASDIYCLHAKSMSEVVIAGSGGYVHQTLDGGANWTVGTSTSPGAILDIDFLNPAIGVAVGNNGTLLTTQDGGMSWSMNSVVSLDLKAVDMVSDGTGWISGYSGLILKSAYAANDLFVYEYHGLDTLCSGVDTDVIITIQNYGPGPIQDADFILLDGSTPFHYYHWTGFLTGGSYLDINLGLASVDHSGYFTCVISGDSVDANNISNKYIEVVTNPAVTSGPHTICAGDSVEINANGGLSYQWLNIPGDSLNPVQTVAPLNSQNYYVMVKSEYCNALDSVEVLVADCYAAVTAISPNSDGKNDYLYLHGITGTENSLKIYNRWGDLINSYTNYDNETVVWSGTDFSGNQLIEGTYFYVFETTDLTQRLISWVQVVR